MLLGNYLGLLGVLLTFWGCCGPAVVPDDELRGQDIHSYTGLVRNFSGSAISIPSQNSGATLIVPAGGQMEYTVWKPKFDISGYVNGVQVYHRNINIGPGTKYTFLGRTYDFLAEVCPELPAHRIMPRQCPPPGRIEPELPRKVCPG
jgi:hypothetical protein